MFRDWIRTDNWTFDFVHSYKFDFQESNCEAVHLIVTIQKKLQQFPVIGIVYHRVY